MFFQDFCAAACFYQRVFQFPPLHNGTKTLVLILLNDSRCILDSSLQFKPLLPCRTAVLSDSFACVCRACAAVCFCALKVRQSRQRHIVITRSIKTAVCYGSQGEWWRLKRPAFVSFRGRYSTWRQTEGSAKGSASRLYILYLLHTSGGAKLPLIEVKL